MGEGHELLPEWTPSHAVYPTMVGILSVRKIILHPSYSHYVCLGDQTAHILNF